MSLTAGAVESLLRQAEALPPGSARDIARDLTKAVLELHRLGLVRLLELLRDAGPAGQAILQQAARDELLANLLVLHELHGPAEPRGFVPVDRLTPRRATEPCVQCELCAQALAVNHPHVLDAPARKVACSCEPCALLFEGKSRRYLRVRTHSIALEGFRLTDAAWAALGVPVKLAFFTRVSAVDAVVAAYPGPAGAVEATVEPSAWQVLMSDNPPLLELRPDVEALLVNRLAARPRYYRASIDHCYRLAGMVRSQWRGISGGPGVGQVIERFFDSLEASRA